MQYTPAKQITQDSIGMLTPTSAPSNIWLYQLIAYCNSGLGQIFSGCYRRNCSEYILYIGTEFSQFKESFNLANPIVCNKSDTRSFDLNQIFEASLRAVGRQQRGLVVLYTELPGGAQYNITVDKERFIETAQQYRQEVAPLETIERDRFQLYVFNLYYPTPISVNSDLIEAIMSTGGTFIPASEDIYDQKILTNVRLART